jgi:spore germination protein YaaH
VIRRFLALAALLAVFTASLSAPSSVLGDAPIPPLRPDGPVVLPDGRVLPTKPASVHESSVQAEMLAAHERDQIQFVPGDRPQPIGTPDATLSLVSDAGDRITPLGLAAASGATATLANTTSLPNGLRKEVLGFLPYWMLDAGSLQWMQYQLVSTIAYFGVAAYSDGTLATTSVGWSGWNSSAMTSVINAAHSKGVRVVLTVTMMAWDGGAGQAALLGNATARAQLVNAIVTAVANRAADGVNLDFEPVSTTLRDQYTSFVRQLKAGLTGAGVGSYLTVCTMGGAAVWASGYDLAGLTAAGAAEAVFVMGYDFSWSGSARAGGVAPMESPYVLDVQDSIDSYLSIIPGSKIIFGVPYYGRTWLTTSDALNATTVSGASGSSKAYYYTGARNLAATYGRRWDDVGKVPWFAYYDSTRSTWVEGYYDDAASLAEKYDMINARGLAGTGMWTLLMDQGDNALWDLLAAKFVPDQSGATYVALNPARLLDTRVGNGLAGKFSAGVPRTFQVSGRGGVPANATAVTGNLTVTEQTNPGYVFLGPNPTSSPTSSTLNFPVGDNRANGVTLALGAGGTLSATYAAAAGSTHLVFDVTGYFVR